MISEGKARAIVAALVASIFTPSLPAAEAATESLVYSFDGYSSDGRHPYDHLINVKDKLYGVTGGGGSQCGNIGGCGTVFSYDLSTGTETVLYSFCSKLNCADGAFPFASLISVNGLLYGTTDQGGGNTGCGNQYGCGTVFSIDPTTGREKAVYSFCSQMSCADGEYPGAGLRDVNGTLYGTTSGGGGSADCNNCGTVFSIDPATHTETVLHAFQGYDTDGSSPEAGLINVNGTLYGTTYGGGTRGGGTVFAVNPVNGAETMVYSFCSQGSYCSDGDAPEANLLDVNGILYGTTRQGGTTECGKYWPTGCGTVFSFNPSTGAESIIHYFGKHRDGRAPQAAVIDVNGVLYGTTYFGKKGGTVFSLDPKTGTETILYSFCSQRFCRDGAQPTARLTDVKGTLFGTTSEGGAYGGGTIFKITF